MDFDIILLVVASFLMVLGIIGAIAPFLPGPPLCFFALLLAHFTDSIQFSTNFLLFWAIIVIAVSVIDYLIPIWGTKKFGGTKAGMWGATIGLVLGVFFSPIGIIIGPALGAFVGELVVNKNDVRLAFNSALGALVGFVLSTGLKLVVCCIMLFYFIKEIIVVYT